VSAWDSAKSCYVSVHWHWLIMTVANTFWNVCTTRKQLNYEFTVHRIVTRDKTNTRPWFTSANKKPPNVMDIEIVVQRGGSDTWCHRSYNHQRLRCSLRHFYEDEQHGGKSFNANYEIRSMFLQRTLEDHTIVSVTPIPPPMTCFNHLQSVIPSWHCILPMPKALPTETTSSRWEVHVAYCHELKRVELVRHLTETLRIRAATRIKNGLCAMLANPRYGRCRKRLRHEFETMFN
jgi:hypothetical protein